MTLALAVYYWLKVCGKRGMVIKNMSTSRVINDICDVLSSSLAVVSPAYLCTYQQDYDCPVKSSAVGEIFVAEMMVEHNAVIGGIIPA